MSLIIPVVYEPGHPPERVSQLYRLNAAAPDLLAACKALLRDCEAQFGVCECDRSVGLTCNQCRARAAIAKAGGKAESACPACHGTGEVTEAHESYAVETLGCPHCMGSGKGGGTP